MTPFVPKPVEWIILMLSNFCKLRFVKVGDLKQSKSEAQALCESPLLRGGRGVLLDTKYDDYCLRTHTQYIFCYLKTLPRADEKINLLSRYFNIRYFVVLQKGS